MSDYEKPYAKIERQRIQGVTVEDAHRARLIHALDHIAGFLGEINQKLDKLIEKK